MVEEEVKSEETKVIMTPRKVFDPTEKKMNIRKRVREIVEVHSVSNGCYDGESILSSIPNGYNYPNGYKKWQVHEKGWFPLGGR